MPTPTSRARRRVVNRPRGEDIFTHHQADHLACRHADPAAAMGAAGAALRGQAVAFADPLGMYLQTFNSDAFFLNGDPVPEEWIRWSRGEEGLYQRLEFGPGDDDPHFLDDVAVAVGAGERPLRGGYQVVRQLEVGPFVLLGAETPLTDEDYEEVGRAPAAIRCNEAEVCTSIRALHDRFQESQEVHRVAPRRMGRGPRE